MPRLPRTVVVLSWVSFLADVSGEMIYPLIPLFVVGVLGSSATALGGIEGAALCLVAVMSAWAGWHSDGQKRRMPYVRIGYALPVVGKAMLAFAYAWPMVLAGRLVDRVGKGLRSSPRDALIADAAGPQERGRAFGFHRALDTAGAMVGVILAAMLLWWLTGSPADGGGRAAAESGPAFRIVFGVAAALGLLSLATTFLVSDRPIVTSSVAPSTRGAGPRLAMPAAYWRTLVPLLIFSLANSSDAFLLLKAREVGLSPWAVVLAYLLFNVTYTIVSYPAGVLSDRLGRWRVIGLGWVIYAGVYCGFAVAGESAIWPLFALYGSFMALTEGIGKALIVDHAPAERRATALGIYSMANGFVTLAASLAGGVLWDAFGSASTFWFGGSVAAMAAISIPLVARRAT